ncbi:hypothetical protein [Methanobrevibacter ruminantium]|uniref:hypothetical protein n=1 Tax=Methanobrevibacter ruminantium TaxID=83816 RepID=UPI0026ED47DD|nr:hypothetical protein [Methanobrevibacter ruminantium]
MANYDGKILQILHDGLTVKDLLNPSFLSKLDEVFDNKKITPVSLNLIVEEENKPITQIALFHKTSIQTKNKQLIIDIDDPKILDGIVSSVDVVKK